MIKRANRGKSIIASLREQNKSNELFEIMLSNLTLEEIISLKFELLTKTVGKTLYGLPIWRSIEYIVKEAILQYALAVNSSRIKTISFLGLEKKYFYKYLVRYGINTEGKITNEQAIHNK